MKARLAILADAHLANHRRWGGPLDRGINRRCALVLSAIDEAVRIAKVRGCTGIVSAGDLFDGTRPTPQVIAAMQRAIVASGLPWLLLRGNHEMSSEWQRDTALEALAPVADVVDQTSVRMLAGVRVLCVPYHHGDAASWVAAAFARDAGAADLAVIHAGIKDAETPPHLLGAQDAIELERLAAGMLAAGVPHVAAGNWHPRRQWRWEDGSQNAEVCQVGTLCPSRFGEEGPAYGWMAIYDRARGQVFDPVRVPGPRFLSARSREELLAELAQLEPGDVAYARLVVAPDKKDEARTALREVQLTDARVLGFEVALELGAGVERARAAARSTRSPETLNEALARCVRELTNVPEGVDRERILAEARRFLG
jgi:DNA repair exonuclease SbcCD nuclease subunit